MGFDLYDEKTGIAQHYTVWCWRPMWDFCYENKWISKEQYEGGDENSGYTIDKETTEALSQGICDLGDVEETENKIKEFLKESDWDGSYSFEFEDLDTFACFCDDVESFQIC